ncbi:hypothetical protein SDC9_11707 [bioreactor metagenome]|uniref:Uncharacterized protein n=1 Tax=bioreactor metagenome TaxID=1076179 RepID=A0A644TH50_9ZZZZ
MSAPPRLALRAAKFFFSFVRAELIVSTLPSPRRAACKLLNESFASLLFSRSSASLFITGDKPFEINSPKCSFASDVATPSRLSPAGSSFPIAFATPPTRDSISFSINSTALPFSPVDTNFFASSSCESDKITPAFLNAPKPSTGSSIAFPRVCAAEAASVPIVFDKSKDNPIARLNSSPVIAVNLSIALCADLTSFSDIFVADCRLVAIDSSSSAVKPAAPPVALIWASRRPCSSRAFPNAVTDSLVVVTIALIVLVAS